MLCIWIYRFFYIQNIEYYNNLESSVLFKTRVVLCPSEIIHTGCLEFPHNPTCKHGLNGILDRSLVQIDQANFLIQALN